MQRPFDLIRDIFRESNKQNKELLKYVFEKSDSITLWVIGIAIGGISVIANNIANVKSALQPEYLRAILLLLSISVTGGIAYRGSFLYYFILLNHTNRGIDISLSRDRTMDTETYLEGNETFLQLLQIVHQGFEDDLSNLIPLYEQADEVGKKRLYDSVIEHYNKSVLFAQRDTENAFGFIADTYSKFSGIKKEKYLEAMHGKKPFLTDFRVLVITTCFYVIYITSFITALFLFAFSC